MIQCPFCAGELPSSVAGIEQEILYACSNCLNPFRLRPEQGDVVANPIEGVQDIRVVAPPGSVMAGVLDTLNEALEDLPVLPEVPQRILSMVHDPLMNMSDLAKVINEDAVISMRILKLANSAFYASMHEIQDLATACSRVGLKMVANTVNAIANGNLYRTGDPRFRGLMESLWRNAVVTAYCADELTTMARAGRGDVAFMAGLIHEIGKVVLLDIITVKYKGSLGRLREDPELVARVLDKYYLLVGLHVVQKWELAPELTVTTYCHRTPNMVPCEQWLPLTHALCLACAVATSAGYGVGIAEEEQGQLVLSNHPSATYLKLDAAKFDELMTTLPEKVDPLLEVFSTI